MTVVHDFECCDEKLHVSHRNITYRVMDETIFAQDPSTITININIIHQNWAMGNTSFVKFEQSTYDVTNDVTLCLKMEQKYNQRANLHDNSYIILKMRKNYLENEG